MIIVYKNTENSSWEGGNEIWIDWKLQLIYNPTSHMNFRNNVDDFKNRLISIFEKFILHFCLESNEASSISGNEFTLPYMRHSFQLEWRKKS